MTLESLAPHMPAVASSYNNQVASVHQNLSALGTADQVGHPAGLPPTMYARDLKVSGLRYFADVESKERTEAHLQQRRAGAAEFKLGEGVPEEVNTARIIGDAEEAVKKVVLDQVVAGRHEAPKFTTDPLATARNWHLRSETWGPKETKAFESKLASLLSRGAPAGKAKGAKAKA